ncbi:MAG: GTP cyclohydrolase I FolE [Candidatus Peribacteraceae bacterium]|nr:GTP cyclohydrolase I FolE [Candidatus Peribacteraceae bacterium]
MTYAHHRMRNAIAIVLKLFGEDPKRPGLRKTPERWEKAMQFLTSGYGQNLKEVVNGALFPTDTDGMVIVKDIECYSLCEHHLLPFVGKVHVGYIPSEKAIGLSKIARIVDMFARRLQTQERLGQQICDALQDVLKPKGVGVVIEANHFCMMMRGVEKQHSTAVTSFVRGSFRRDARTREEFLRLIRG